MGLKEVILRVQCESIGQKVAFLLQALRVKHAWLSTERALSSVILTAIIIFYTTTKAVFEPLQTLKIGRE